MAGGSLGRGAGPRSSPAAFGDGFGAAIAGKTGLSLLADLGGAVLAGRLGRDCLEEASATAAASTSS